MQANLDDAAPPREPFSVEKGLLRAHADLYWNHLDAFETACGRVLASRSGEIELDLAGVSFISSAFLGCLNNLVLRAGGAGKRVRLRVSQDVSWLFEILGSRRNLDMHVV